MFTDSHCHLNFPELLGEVEPIRAAMQAARVDRALCISTTLEEFDTVHGLALQYDNFWCTVGVHPDNEGVREADLAILLELGRREKVVGIGETGLDYYDMAGRKGGRSIADMEWQRERFRIHIRAARELGKPLVIHTRDSAEATLEILREEGENGPGNRAGGVFHCFVEDEAVARQVLEMGYYISFSGIVTFKNARALKQVAQFVPLDRMLIETDSPYLAPVPYRGKTNNPSYVAHVAEHIAELRGIDVAEVGAATSRNFDNLFKGVRA
ncbi:TatD family deoxyribonuclease [Corticibacter populi]|uniref:TatD family deoxyribonuclease n=1 Tax=Corticibacter populi TaxID=1550736 RepID=A0A3M6R0Q7_9BURK|nr:TatD family hydrolase [Corticibacter populi]RMX08469.1 TatD family deoxyribonuclease [Corticibacter populi]RZS35781.1 TatD DNase family protein [Corticibacter populi]